MKNRWSSDVAYGLLAAAFGALIVGVAVAFGLWDLMRYGLALSALGAAVSAFGAAEFFFTRER